jgi:gamma-glutamylcyclotransferase (GGCT)/AIG2-like uncharacterized protein YtfP
MNARRAGGSARNAVSRPTFGKGRTLGGGGGGGLDVTFTHHSFETSSMVPMDELDATNAVAEMSKNSMQPVRAGGDISSTTFRLLVYGTLKRGGTYHPYLTAQRFVREAYTVPGFSLLDLGPYPALVRRSDGGAVHGELFEVEATLRPVLDRLEGAPTYYRLERVEVDGEDASVFAYVYQLDAPDAPECPGGRWDGPSVSGPAESA